MTQVVARLKTWELDRYLRILLGVLVFLFLVQGLRCGVSASSARGLTDSLKRTAEAPPSRTEVSALEDYDPILDKGILGKRVKKEAPSAKLFGILGSQALLGMSPGDAKFYDVDADVPGGEKLIEIRVSEVVLEKDGVTRTLDVFGDAATPPRPGGPPAPSGPAKKDAQEDASDKPQPTEDVAAPDAAPSAWVITAETLGGTKWSFQGMTIAFYSGGTFQVDAGSETMDGTWRIEGDTLFVTIQGNEQTGQIDGDRLIVDGNELERVE